MRSLVAATAILVAPAAAAAHAPATEELRDAYEHIFEDPYNIENYLVRADLYLRGGEPGLALADIEIAEELDPLHSGPTLLRARVLLSQGDRRGAILALERHLSLAPTHRGFALRAAAWAELGETGAALEDYRAALALAPSLETYVAAAALLPPAEAAALLEAGMRRMDDAVVLRLAAFDAHMRAGAPLRALALADAILPALRVDTDWRLRRAEALAAAGQGAAAQRERERSLRQAEQQMQSRPSVQNQVLRARALAALGRTAEARRDLEAALARLPEHREARALVAQLPQM